MHPGTLNVNDDSSDNDENQEPPTRQPNSDQVGVPESFQNRVDQGGNSENQNSGVNSENSVERLLRGKMSCDVRFVVFGANPLFYPLFSLPHLELLTYH